MAKTRLRDVPTPMSPDPDILAALREVDPDADLLYLGEGRWALGTVTPHNQIRLGRAEKIVARAEARGAQADPAKVRLGKAALEGFRLVREYYYTEVQSGFATLDFRRMTHLWNNERDAAERELFGDSELIPPHLLDERLDRTLYEARSAHAYLFRGKKHFLQGG